MKVVGIYSNAKLNNELKPNVFDYLLFNPTRGISSYNAGREETRKEAQKSAQMHVSPKSPYTDFIIIEVDPN